MSKTKRMKPYVYAISMMMQRENIPATGVYDTVNSTPSKIYDPYEHVLEYKSY